MGLIATFGALLVAPKAFQKVHDLFAKSYNSTSPAYNRQIAADLCRKN